MKNIFLGILGLFSFTSVDAASFLEAVGQSCMKVACDAACEADPVLYAAAEKKCADSSNEITISCDSMELTTALNGLKELSGEDDVANPLDCSYTKDADGKSEYTCESYQGSHYGDLKLSSSDSIDDSGEFNLKIELLADMGDDSVTPTVEELDCEVEIDTAF